MLIRPGYQVSGATTCNETVSGLEAVASPQVQKTWMNHGANESCLGVQIEGMNKLQHRTNAETQLVLELYETGIVDPVYFTGTLIDDSAISDGTLENWLERASGPWVEEYTVPWVDTGGRHARKLAIRWMNSSNETTATAGWQLYSSFVMLPRWRASVIGWSLEC